MGSRSAFHSVKTWTSRTRENFTGNLEEEKEKLRILYDIAQNYATEKETTRDLNNA